MYSKESFKKLAKTTIKILILPILLLTIGRTILILGWESQTIYQLEVVRGFSKMEIKVLGCFYLSLTVGLILGFRKL